MRAIIPIQGRSPWIGKRPCGRWNRGCRTGNRGQTDHIGMPANRQRKPGRQGCPLRLEKEAPEEYRSGSYRWQGTRRRERICHCLRSARYARPTVDGPAKSSAGDRKSSAKVKSASPSASANAAGEDSRCKGKPAHGETPANGAGNHGRYISDGKPTANQGRPTAGRRQNDINHGKTEARRACARCLRLLGIPSRKLVLEVHRRL